MGLFSKKTKIGVHSGSFHPDDVFAVATLRLVLDNDVRVIRTRDANELALCDYVVDVGSVYDVAQKRFDHHQKGGAGERENGIPFASFGLVWKEYGKQICDGNERVANKIDKELVQFVDAMDNGVGTVLPVKADVYPFDVCAIIALMDPSGDEESLVNEYFNRAVNMAQTILESCIYSFKLLFAGEKYIADAYAKAEDKRIIVLERSVEWRELIPQYKDVVFVVEEVPKVKQWKVRSVRDNIHDFTSTRKDLPLAWAGKQGSELAAVTGVSDALFCHNKRFIVTAGTKESALILAKKAL